VNTSYLIYRIKNVAYRALQFFLVIALEVFLRLTPLWNLGEAAGPIIMFIIPVSFYIVLWLEDISFSEVECACIGLLCLPSPHLLALFLVAYAVL
jgi:hypothetical protein